MFCSYYLFFCFCSLQPRDTKTDKPLSDIIIIKTEVFTDPLIEATEMLEALIKERQDARLTATSRLSKATGGAAGEAPERENLRLAAVAASERKGWHSAPTPVLSSSSTSVGKYMVPQNTAPTLPLSASVSKAKEVKGTVASLVNEPLESIHKKQKVAGTKFKDFSSW